MLLKAGPLCKERPSELPKAGPLCKERPSELPKSGPLCKERPSKLPKAGPLWKLTPISRALLSISFGVPSKGALFPGSHHRAPWKRDTQSLEPYFINLSKSPGYINPLLGSHMFWLKLYECIYIKHNVGETIYIYIKHNVGETIFITILF